MDAAPRLMLSYTYIACLVDIQLAHAMGSSDTAEQAINYSNNEFIRRGSLR